MLCSHRTQLTTYWRVTYICSSANNSEMDFPVFALSPNVFLRTSLVLEILTYCKRESSSESKRLKWRSGQKVHKVWSNTTSFVNRLNLFAISEPFCCSNVSQGAENLMTFLSLSKAIIFVLSWRTSVLILKCILSTMLRFAFSEESNSVEIVHSNACDSMQ